MPHTPLTTDTNVGDTPPPQVTAPPRPRADEYPPYGEPSRARFWLIVALVVAALVVAAWAAVTVIRKVFGLLFGGPTLIDGGTVIMTPEPTASRGTMYRVEFFDGNYRQLAKQPIEAVIDEAQPIYPQLESLAARLKARVLLLDSQRCDHPRVVLYDRAGRVWREYP